VNRGAALSGALLVTIATPATWSLGLATFLVRGGILVFLVPIVVLPTTTGLANVLGPVVTSVAFGSVPAATIVVSGVLALGLAVCLTLVGWLAGALEGEGIRIIAMDEETFGSKPGPVQPVDGRLAARILVTRLLAAIPFAVVLGWGAARLATVTYGELTSPFDVDTPIAIRVILATPEVVVALLVAWMISGIIGAMAVRRVVLSGDGVVRSLRIAVATSVRHPLVSLARFWIPTVALVAVLVPSVLAARAAWRAIAAALRDPSDPRAILTTVLVLVVLWATGLLLCSVVCAWRSAVWTVAAVGDERDVRGVHRPPTG
jgi:hypothetical protein